MVDLLEPSRPSRCIVTRDSMRDRLALRFFAWNSCREPGEQHFCRVDRARLFVPAQRWGIGCAIQRRQYHGRSMYKILHNAECQNGIARSDKDHERSCGLSSLVRYFRMRAMTGVANLSSARRMTTREGSNGRDWYLRVKGSTQTAGQSGGAGAAQLPRSSLYMSKG